MFNFATSVKNVHKRVLKVPRQCTRGSSEVSQLILSCIALNFSVNRHCMSYKNVFLFDYWTSVSFSKSTYKSKNLTKNGLWDHIIPDLTNKEKSDNQTKKYFFKSPYGRHTLKVWKESVKSTLSWKGLKFQPNLAYLGVERTTFSKS